MFHKPVSGLSGIVFLVLCAPIATAQDFHVDTQIYDLKAPAKAGKPQSVGAAESLFHAGKVYDHNRGVNEMTIYEPAQERFVIVDTTRNLKTAISFSEITDHLIEDRASAQTYVADAEKRGLPPDRVAFIKFQLKPDFQVKFTPHAQSPKLVMTSPLAEYHVECAAEGSREILQAYLEYADWAARLSFITRRQSMLPDVRLAVNEELRRRNLLPVKVTLITHTQVPKEIHYRAEHKFGWELNGYDKSTISHWDAHAAAKTTKLVPWEKYFEPSPQTAKRK
jgi:hypothetical protein